MCPPADSFNDRIRAMDNSLMERFGGSSDHVIVNHGDQDSFLASTRTQLVGGENALLCGDFNEASRAFLRVIISFEQHQEVDMKDHSSTMSSSTSSSISAPLDGCRVRGQPTTMPAPQQPQQQQQVQSQDSQQAQQELRQRHRQQQIVTLLGSALYGLGTTYMLQGYFDHAQPALQQAVYLYWRLYGEGSPLLELARTQLHRLYCYWEMVHQEQQLQQIHQQQQLMPGAYQLQQPTLQPPSNELSFSEHYRRNGEDFNDDDYQTDDDVDSFDDEDFDNDDIAMFPEEFEFDEETYDHDEHHVCYCPGEICRIFSRSVRHAAAA